MSLPALLMRLLLSALLILGGSVDARAIVSMPMHAAGGDQQGSPSGAMQAHCAHSSATATAPGHEAMAAMHGDGHAHHADTPAPSADVAVQPDCDCVGEQACSHACHANACAAAATPTLPQPVVFERGQDLFPHSAALRAAPPAYQAIRPPIC